MKIENLKIDCKIKHALKEMSISELKPVQKKCIPILLKNNDIMAAAKTGSGKTLAFLIPLVNRMINISHSRNFGTLAVILSPTRELAEQTYIVLEKLVADTDISIGILVGGKNRKVQAKSLKAGISIIVATPGRLLDHMLNTNGFYYAKCQFLIIDEADKLMTQGFLEDMESITNKLPKDRQTALFSATLKMDEDKMHHYFQHMSKVKTDDKKLSLQDKVFKLAYLSLNKNCVFVDFSCKEDDKKTGNDGNDHKTNAQLSEFYWYKPPCQKLNSLVAFLMKHTNEKMMIFMATGAEVEYYWKLFVKLQSKVNIINQKLSQFQLYQIHGKMSQNAREENLKSFKESESSVLFCTDVAARGLDFVDIHWVIQWDLPSNYDEYIHRVGRTARAGRSGCALVYIRRSEIKFLEMLKYRKHKYSSIHDNELAPTKEEIIPDCQWLVDIVKSDSFLLKTAKDAFVGLYNAFIAGRLKHSELSDLDLNNLALEFALDQLPDGYSNSMLDCRKRKLKTKSKQAKRQKI